MSAKIDDQFAAHLRAALQAHVMTTPARDRRTRQRTALGAGIGVLILGGGVAYARTDIEDGHGLGSAERLARRSTMVSVDATRTVAVARSWRYTQPRQATCMAGGPRWCYG